MKYVQGRGGTLPTLTNLKFFPLDINNQNQIKICMILDTLLKNLSVEKIPQFLLISPFLCEHLSKKL